MASLLEDLSSQFDVLGFFSSTLQRSEEFCVDADLVLASITHCGQEQIK